MSRKKTTLILFVICSCSITINEAGHRKRPILESGHTKKSLRDFKVRGFSTPQKLAGHKISNSAKKYNEEEDTVGDNCWVNLHAKMHFETMDNLDDKYAEARKTFNRALIARNLDKEMLEMMIQSRAVAERAVNHAGSPSRIPAGINLGGYGMMRMPNSMLFFHRMKLRNETNFRVNYLNNDLNNMVLISRISLNDLHLYGSYMRAVTDKDPSVLFYRPTYGEVEFLLKDVYYKMEGRYRLVQNRLRVEDILSELHIKDVLMMYANGTNDCAKPAKIPPSAIDDFLGKLKADLDTWLKDYFNDYLSQIDLTAENNEALQKYEKEKVLALNDYVDMSLLALKQRLHSLTPPAADIKVPSFTLYTVTGVQIKLYDGVIRGVDSFYRQTVATGRRDEKIRAVDAVVGFNKLKLEYRYLAVISRDIPSLYGLFVLTAEDLVAHFGMSMVKEPESVDLVFAYKRPNSPQTLVVEGAINRQLSNFKYLLEDQIIAIMSNTLLFHIKLLGTLTRCEPLLRGHEDPGDASDEVKLPDGSEKKRGVSRNDSIELIIPGEGDDKSKKLRIKYYENLQLEEMAADARTNDDKLKKISKHNKPKHHKLKKQNKPKHHNHNKQNKPKHHNHNKQNKHKHHTILKKN